MENSQFTRLRTLYGPTKLHTILTLYYKARYEHVYIAYFAGFKLLRDWLGPIALPTNDLEIPSWVQRLSRNYEHNELAKLLNTSPVIIQATEFYIKGANIWTPEY